MPIVFPFSDTHLRGDEPWPMSRDLRPFDVAVVAGDVDDGPDLAMRRLATAPGLAGRTVLFVPGNHEFYERYLEDEEHAEAPDHGEARVIALHERAVVVDGVRFVGATLWTDYALYRDPERAMVRCRLDLADHTSIRTRDGMEVDDDPDLLPQFRRPWRFFQPADARERHRRQLAFLDAALGEPFDGPTVVVTHHAPHPDSLSPDWQGHPSNPGYATDLTGLIEWHRPAVWIHGHVHTNSDYRVGETRIVANPMGGVSEGRWRNPGFDPNLRLDVRRANGHP